jgi:hypothetical protein
VDPGKEAILPVADFATFQANAVKIVLNAKEDFN